MKTTALHGLVTSALVALAPAAFAQNQEAVPDQPTPATPSPTPTEEKPVTTPMDDRGGAQMPAPEQPFAQPDTTTEADKTTEPAPGTEPAQEPSTTSEEGVEPQAQMQTQEIMQLTQTAMTHIQAAEDALAKDDTKAAEEALSASEDALEKLYDAPVQRQVLGQFDEAIDQFSEPSAAAQTDASEQPDTAAPRVDLAPLASSVTKYETYVDPSVRANIDRAQESADQGDNKGAERALRLARSKVAVDMAFVPVETAYTHVLAAQQALSQGENERAARILQGVPIVVSQVQVSQPLVPIRFELQAAAAAAEAGDNERAQQLLSKANEDMQELIKTPSEDEEIQQQLSQLGDEIEQLDQQVADGSELDAAQIRQIAERTRNIGNFEEEDRG